MMGDRGYFEPDVKWDRISPHMREHIRAYVEEFRPIGHFLTALLSNDLMIAALRADDENRAALADWAGFLYEYAPSNCWGSPEIVAAWLARKGDRDCAPDARGVDSRPCGSRLSDLRLSSP